jgi:eukaryotic-like serine/threonine-protein kinase
MSKLDEDVGAAFEVGRIIDGRYRVVRLIGQGGNGLVHEVEHLLTGRRFALKSLLEESAVARLEQEARAAGLIRNRHVVMITDMGQSKDIGPYLVMELLEGQSLRALLEETGQLPLELTVNIGLQVCECLEEAHQAGLVHRDLKPDNIYLCPAYGGQYDIKVLDFGVVKIAGGGPIPNSSLTRTGSTVGTPFYMSLEQLRNSSNVDARSDVYALSVVLYESLSGSKPFQAETIGDLVYALCSGPPSSLDRVRPDLPKAIADVIMRGLSSNRDDRPASMHDLATILAPHGDPAYGLWLRATQGSKSMTVPRMPEDVTQSDAKSPEPPAAEPPSPPSEGVPSPPVAPPKAASPVPSKDDSPTTPPPPLAPPRPGSPPARPALTTPLPPPTAAVKPTAPPPRRPEPPTPSGDRDTPTEMYVKDVHGAETPESPEITQRDTPTEAIEGFQEKLSASIAQTAAIPPMMGSGDTTALPAISDRAAISDPSSIGDPDLSTRRMPPGSLHLEDPTLGPDTATLAAFAKPAWQRGIESAGQTAERWVVSFTNWFRGASPQQQLVVVVIGASFVGVVVVLLLYGVFASSGPPPAP